MTEVRIIDGVLVVDVDAWLGQRAGDEHPAMTASLREFTGHDIFDQHQPPLGAEDRMRLWCAARDLAVTEPHLIRHDDQVLSSPVTVMLAAAADRTAYALVQVGSRPAAVFIDRTVDEHDWAEVRSVDIMCPADLQHAWTWAGGLTVVDMSGSVTAITELFADSRPTPLRCCRDCAAYDDGHSSRPCHCDQPVTIYCPLCDTRCGLELTHVPVLPRPKN